MGNLPAQISVSSWGNFPPQPSATHGCDTFRVAHSAPSFSFQSPALCFEGRSAGNLAWGSLSLSDSTLSPLILKITPLDKKAVTQMVFWLYRHRLLFCGRCFFEVCSVSWVTATHPGQDVVCMGVSKEVFANRPSVHMTTRLPFLPVRSQRLR